MVNIKKKSLNSKNIQLFTLALPGMLALFIFSYIPLYGLVLPFKNYKYNLGFWKSEWIGWDNFKFLFQSDTAFKIAYNTVFLNCIFIITLMVTSLCIALAFNELSRRWIKFYQTAMFFPHFLSWVVASYVLLALLDMEHGVLNSVIEKLGGEEILWYSEPKLWPSILTISNIWKSAGYNAIIYYAAIIGIDSTYYEAAQLDGASRFQQIKHITIPSILPIISIMFLLAVGKIFFGNFDMFYNLTRDSGILYSTTDIIDTFVFRALRSTGDIGMASAAGMYQSVVGLAIVVAVNTVIRKLNPDNAMF